MRNYRAIGKMLGVDKWHGWQELWLTGMSEMKPDGTPRRRRRNLMLGRQGGKSKISPTVAIEHVLSGQHVVYTAQERGKAEDNWREWIETWRANCPPQFRGEKTYAQGRQIWKIPGLGSFRFLTPDRESPRGLTLDVVMVDESAWVMPGFLDTATGTLSTSPNWVIYELCTAGDANRSICAGFQATREAGLLSLTPDAEPWMDEIFWMEYAAGEDDDPKDEKVWERVIPTLDSTDPRGVQRSLIRSEYQKHEKRGTLQVFAREYLCQWTMPPKEQRFDIDMWTKCAAEVSVPNGATVAIDISPDREHAAIVAAYARSDHDVVVEVLRAMSGSEWVARELTKLNAKNPGRIARVVVDDLVCGSLKTELSNRGFWVEGIGYRQYARWHAAFTDLVKRRDDTGTPALRQRPHPALDAAVQAAGIRKLGEGQAWNRRTESESPICALVAATLAVGAAQEMPQAERLVL